MLQINDIILENSTTFSERREIASLTENQIGRINNAMISNIYKAAIEKSHIDFGDIPRSKGNLTAYPGYTTMVKTISVFKELPEKSDNMNEAVNTIERAMNNIITYRDLFEKGFKLNKEFIILLYNSIVYACVESVSEVLTTYIDFVVHPEKVEFQISEITIKPGRLCLENLRKFNDSVNSGDFQKSVRQIISAGKENFIGPVPLLAIGSIILIVPILRELIFYFYYSRMKLSEYLEQQAAFLEVHQENMNNERRYYNTGKPLSVSDKKKIAEKQNQRIKLLRQIAGKVQVDSVHAERDAKDNIKDQNKKWTFNEVKSQSLNNDINGFQII